MRVAIDARLAINPPTGIGRVAVNLIDGLSKLPEPPEIVAITRGGALPELAHSPYVLHAKVPIGHLSHKVQTDLPRVIKTSGAELVHYQYFVIPVVSPVPSVVTIHDTIYSRFPTLIPPHHRLLYSVFMRCCVRQARRIICVSQASADDLCRFFPRTPRENIRVVPNGVEERFRPLETDDPTELRAKLGLPEHYVLYVGNHRGHKNLPRLIQAFAGIARDLPHSLVLPSAKGRGSELTEHAISSAGVGERVIYHPLPDESLPAIYSLADAFVLPSLAEGFGLPALEAMACGTPVVTSNTTSLPEVVGDAAITVDPYSIDDLAQAIRAVLTDEALSRTLRTKGLARSREFTWRRTAELTLQTYREALSGL